MTNYVLTTICFNFCRDWVSNMEIQTARIYRCAGPCL